MKPSIETMLKFLFAWALISFIAMACLVLFGCNTQKKLAQSSQELKAKTDLYTDSSHQLRFNLRQDYHQKTELEKQSGIHFQPIECPPVIIPESCPRDSLVKLIGLLQRQIAAMRNTIRINEDGSIEAQGLIASVSAESLKKSQANEQLRLGNEELQQHNSRLQSELKALQKNKTKDVSRKPGWAWLIWLVPAFIAGLLIEYNFKIISRIKKLVSFIKPPIS